MPRPRASGATHMAYSPRPPAVRRRPRPRRGPRPVRRSSRRTSRPFASPGAPASARASSPPPRRASSRTHRGVGERAEADRTNPLPSSAVMRSTAQARIPRRLPRSPRGTLLRPNPRPTQVAERGSMSKVSASDVRKGMLLAVGDRMCRVVSWNIWKSDRRSRIQMKFKEILTGRTSEVTAQPDDRYDVLDAEVIDLEHSYRDGPDEVFYSSTARSGASRSRARGRALLGLAHLSRPSRRRQARLGRAPADGRRHGRQVRAAHQGAVKRPQGRDARQRPQLKIGPCSMSATGRRSTPRRWSSRTAPDRHGAGPSSAWRRRLPPSAGPAMLPAASVAGGLGRCSVAPCYHGVMSQPVKLSDALVLDARVAAEAMQRSIAGKSSSGLASGAPWSRSFAGSGAGALGSATARPSRSVSPRSIPGRTAPRGDFLADGRSRDSSRRTPRDCSSDQGRRYADRREIRATSVRRGKGA